MTTREKTADHAELAAIISDDEIARVHGRANFGAITPREVVNDGVRKYAVGYHSGHTQLCILMEHGLITKPRPGSYDANLTKKGKKYARVLYRREEALLSEIAALKGERDGLRKALERLMRAYVNLLEIGRDRIVMLGGECDPVDRMEEGDPALIAARQALVTQGAE